MSCEAECNLLLSAIAAPHLSGQLTAAVEVLPRGRKIRCLVKRGYRITGFDGITELLELLLSNPNWSAEDLAVSLDGVRVLMENGRSQMKVYASGLAIRPRSPLRPQIVGM
jgi:hypothetical protein